MPALIKNCHGATPIGNFQYSSNFLLSSLKSRGSLISGILIFIPKYNTNSNNYYYNLFNKYEN